MKKILKIIGVLSVVVLVLLAAASLALRFLLPPEKAKALVLKHLAANLKREVQVGNVSIGLFSGLSLTDLKVSEAPDFSKGTFIASKRFSIRLALLPLLSKRIEVKQLVLDQPAIQVVRYPDGKTFNFSDLTETSTAPAPSTPKAAHAASRFSLVSEAHAAAAPAPGSEPPFKLLISHAQIVNGTVRFVDQSPARQSVAIDALDLKLSNVSTTAPFSVVVSLNAKANQLQAKLKMAGDADLAAGSLKIKDCKVSSGDAALSLTGDAERLKTTRPAVNLKLQVKDLKLAAWKPFLGLPPDLKLTKPIQADAHIQGDEEKMDLTFATAYGAIKLKGHGKVLAVKSPQPQIQMHVESGVFPVSELLEIAPKSLPAGMTVGGQTQVSADVAGTQASSRIAAKCDGKDLSITLPEKFNKPAGVPFRILLTGENLREVFNIQNFSGVLGDIELSGNGSVQTAGKTPKFQISAKSKPFSLQTLASFVPMLAVYKPGGTAVLDVRASGTADAPLANGSLSLQNVSVRFHQSDLSNVSTQMMFTHQDMSIPKLTGKLNGSDFTLKMTGRRLTTQPEIHAEGSLAELDLEKWLEAPPTGRSPEGSGWIPAAWAAPAAAPAPPMKLSGTLTIGRVKHEFYDAKNLDMKWNLTEVTPDLARMSGTAGLKQGAGVLQDVEKLMALSKTARVVLLPLGILQKIDRKGALRKVGLPIPSLERIPFEGIRGDYAFRSGTMDIKSFDVMGTDFGVNMVGTVGLAGEQALDLKMMLKFSKGAIRGTAEKLIEMDELGRPFFTFIARGSVVNPEVKMDLTASTRKAAENLGREILNGLGLGGKRSEQAPPPPAPDAPAPPAPSPEAPAQGSASDSAPPPDPAKQLEKVFKNIFK